VISSISSILS